MQFCFFLGAQGYVDFAAIAETERAEEKDAGSVRARLVGHGFSPDCRKRHEIDVGFYP